MKTMTRSTLARAACSISPLGPMVLLAIVITAVMVLASPQRAWALDLQLKGKTALITGSTANIGYATAEGLLKEGADVIINGRTQASVDKAAASLKAATGRDPLKFAYVASPLSSATTGAALRVDGGVVKSAF